MLVASNVLLSRAFEPKERVRSPTPPLSDDVRLQWAIELWHRAMGFVEEQGSVLSVEANHMGQAGTTKFVWAFSRAERPAAD